jgi:DNA-binding response OmpR family regulator
MRRRPIVLIVEDDRVLRELYRVALGLSSFAVHACEDGLDALRYLEGEQPDAIVLDLQLPRVSGVSIFQELRAHPATERVPIIIVTGVDPVPHLPGATIIRKPCSTEQLTAAVEHALRPQQNGWLFSREDQSVRIVRIVEANRPVRLFVYGPGQDVALYEEQTFADCIIRQSSLERKLVSEGYVMEKFRSGERRSGCDRRIAPRGADRRRPSAELQEMRAGFV